MLVYGCQPGRHIIVVQLQLQYIQQLPVPRFISTVSGRERMEAQRQNFSGSPHEF